MLSRFMLLELRSIGVGGFNCWLQYLETLSWISSFRVSMRSKEDRGSERRRQSFLKLSMAWPISWTSRLSIWIWIILIKLTGCSFSQSNSATPTQIQLPLPRRSRFEWRRASLPVSSCSAVPSYRSLIFSFHSSCWLGSRGLLASSCWVSFQSERNHPSKQI